MNIIFPLSMVDGINGGGGFFFLFFFFFYKKKNIFFFFFFVLFFCMNSCMYARKYVYLCICMLVCMHVCVYVWRMTLVMSKRKQNSSFVVRKYLLFYRQAIFFTEATNFTEAVASFASALSINSVSVTTSAKKIYVPPLEFGGAKSIFFRDLGA